MVALINQPQVIRIDLHHTEGADPGLSNRVFWSYTSNAPSVANMNQLASDIAGFWGADLGGLADTQTHLVEVVCTDLTSTSSARGSWTGSTAGVRAGAFLPANCCTLLNFQIARRYRGGKPRMYAPWGVDGDLADDQHWTTAFQNAVVTGWTAFVGSVSGHIIGATQLGHQVSCSFYAGVDAPVTLDSGRVKQSSKARTAADAIPPDSVSSFSVNPIVGSQRRRLRAGS